jgi:hypothetical protein
MEAKVIFLLAVAMMSAATISIFGSTISAVEAKVVSNHECSGSGFERADCNNHQHTGSTPSDLSQKDVQFHVVMIRSITKC